MPARKTPLAPRPYFLINQLQLAIVQRLEPDLAKLGITPSVARVLNAIATRPGISSSELARMFGIAPQSIKQSIAILETHDMVQRAAHKGDQRVMPLELTEKGWDAWDGHMAAIGAMYGDIFRGLNNREMQTLTKLLTKAVAVARPDSLIGYKLEKAADDQD